MADRSVSVFLNASVSGFVAGIEKAKLATADLSKQMGVAAATAEKSATAHKDSWDKVGKGMLITGGIIAAGVGYAIKAAAEFNAQMSVVQANVDNKTAPSMKRLSDAAMAAGKSTMFSATQAATAENELAKAGLTAADITGGALAGALSLASAGQLELGQAAEIAATTMVQFGLKAKDVPHIADLLAAGADKALGGVGDLAEAMKYSGVVAHQFGISVEETTGVLAMFAMNGLQGSMAGTGFREMLVMLAKPTAEGAAELKKYNIAVFDTKGHFVGMAGLAGQLKTQLAGLTDQQREATLVTLFGTRALAEANILYAAGATGVKKWTASVNDQGFAALQASTKLNNLNGDLTILKTSLNVALIQGGQGAQGPLRALTQDLTGVVNLFAGLPGPVANAGMEIATVTAAALLMGGAVVMATSKWTAMTGALEKMGVESGKATTMMKGFAGAVGIAAIAIPLLNAAADKVSTSLGEMAPGTSEASRALLEFATTGKATGDSAVLINTHFGDLANTVNNVLSNNLGHRFAAFWSDISPGNLAGFEKSQTSLSIEFFKTLDTGMTALVSSGHGEQAAALFKRVSDEAVKQGYSISKVADAFPAYAAAVAGGSDKAAKSVAEVARQAAKLSELSVTLGGQADATGSAMRLLGAGADAASDAVKALAKTIQGDMDSAAKAFASDVDVLGSFDPKKQADAVAAAQQTLTKAREAAAKSKPGKADTSVQDAQAALDKARQDQVNASLSNSYKTQITAGKKFATDIAAVTKAGLDPNVIAKLLQEGPAKAAPALEAMLGSNSKTMIKMVNDSEKQLAAINARVVEQSRITSMAVNSQSDQLSTDFTNAMAVSNAKATLGAQATVQAIATQLHLGEAAVRRIAAEYGIGIAEGVKKGVTPAKETIATLQAKMDSVKQGKSKIPGMTVNTAQGREQLRIWQAQIDALRGKNIVVTTTLFGQRVAQGPGGQGGITRAGGGLLHGPGTGTSDSIMGVDDYGNHIANVSDKEYVVNAAQTAKHLPLLEAINSGAHGFATGGGINLSLPATAPIQAALNAAPPPAVIAAVGAAFAGMAGSGVQRWLPIVLQALGLTGQPASLAQTLLRRMNQESSGNPNAINLTDINARNGIPSQGLMQTVPPTFAHYRLKSLSSNILDPLSNIVASIRYTLATYGSLAAGYNRAGGYAAGTDNAAPGWAMVGERGPELVQFKGGERVVPHLASGGLATGGRVSSAPVSSAASKAEQAARAAAAAQIAANKEIWVFDHKTAVAQLADVDKKLKAEKTYSDNWMTLARQRETLAQTIADEAKKAATDAQAAADALAKTATDYAATVSGKQVGLGGLAGLFFNSDNQIMALSNVKEGLKTATQSAKDFQATISALSAAGLDKSLLDQIIGEGAARGGKMGSAILAGGGSAISDLNGLQAGLVAASAGLGKTASDGMYGSGVQTVTGLVAGLASMQPALDAQMVKVANTLTLPSPAVVRFVSAPRSPVAAGVGAGSGGDTIQLNATFEVDKQVVGRLSRSFSIEEARRNGSSGFKL